VACHDLLRLLAPEASPVCCVCLSPLKLSTSEMVGRGGFEPPTSRLSGGCANHCAIGPPAGPSKPYHHAHSVPRKEVIQPHLPIRLPCYDFTPIIHPTVDGVVPTGFDRPASGVADSRGVTGGVYKARERIHRGMLIRDY
jgi:hypothetical protein